jgi:hypothetical protein
MKIDKCPECDRTNGEHEEWCSIGRNWLSDYQTPLPMRKLTTAPEWMNPRDLEADGTPRDYRDPQEKP